MSLNRTNLASRQKLDEISRQREVLLARCMVVLATGLGVEITSERVMLYQRPLSDLSDSQIRAGFDLALREYKPYGGSFPSPAELREYALRSDVRPRGFIDDAKEILARDIKPPDWEPFTADEIRRLIAEGAKKMEMRR